VPGMTDRPRITVIGAPTNLGLRPPQETSVPGSAKAPEALREAGLHERLFAGGAIDGGNVIAPRYVDDRREVVRAPEGRLPIGLTIVNAGPPTT